MCDVCVYIQKARVKPVYRRTLSAAELYNLPLPELSHPSNIFTDNHIRTVRVPLHVYVCESGHG